MPDATPSLRAAVRLRAQGQCEYCRILDSLTLIPHQLDHIIPIKHGGDTSIENLALSCALCNKHKGTDLASIDPETGELERLFHPRRDQWNDHFEMRGASIQARTGVGRVTIRLLQLNRAERVKERESMLHS